MIQKISITSNHQILAIASNHQILAVTLDKRSIETKFILSFI